jgi:hypothetical protein
VTGLSSWSVEGLGQGEEPKPVRVISFNTAEGWSRDVSEEIALTLMEACAKNALEDFIDQHRMP